MSDGKHSTTAIFVLSPTYSIDLNGECQEHEGNQCATANGCQALQECTVQDREEPETQDGTNDGFATTSITLGPYQQTFLENFSLLETLAARTRLDWDEEALWAEIKKLRKMLQTQQRKEKKLLNQECTLVKELGTPSRKKR